MDKTKSTHNCTHRVCKGTMLILGKESICSTLASEVRAVITQRFKEMKQLPTDTPSHVKALNKLEREAGDCQEQSHYPIEIELRYTDMSTGGQSNRKMKRQQSLTHCYLVNPKHLSTPFLVNQLVPRGWVRQVKVELLQQVNKFICCFHYK